MNIQIEKKYIEKVKAILKPEEDSEIADDYVLGYEYLDDLYSGWNKDGKCKVNLSKISDVIIQLISDNSEGTVSRQINGYKNLLENGTTKPITQLQQIPIALKSCLKDSKSKILWKNDIDNNILPFVVTNCKYSPKDRYSEANVRISLRYNVLNSTKEASIYLNKSDLRENLTLPEILAANNYIIDNEDYIDIYNEDVKYFSKYVNDVGRQMIASKHAYTINSGWYSSSRPIKLDSGRNIARVVIDDGDELKKEDKLRGRAESSYWGTYVKIPYHLIVYVFDLNKHDYYSIHTNNLKEYVYDSSVMDKLILKDEHKFIISKLVENTDDLMEDIIQGKTGGKIIISTGVPGVGKTLTAECYSEIIKRPIYKVQCAQLGLNVDDLEDNLQKILYRAERWKAILLIDEADVYIRKRGEDIHQNAVVGVFLRILEYYAGVLFMTSNRGDMIDDAIMSRATVHVKYDLPIKTERVAISKVLCDQFHVDYNKELEQFFIDNHVSGRDIKSILKLANVIKEQDTITTKDLKRAVAYVHTYEDNSKE